MRVTALHSGIIFLPQARKEAGRRGGQEAWGDGSREEGMARWTLSRGMRQPRRQVVCNGGGGGGGGHLTLSGSTQLKNHKQATVT